MSGNITDRQDVVSLARSLGISVEDAKAIDSGQKRLSDVMPDESVPDFDEFYDARDQARMFQEMHERRHLL